MADKIRLSEVLKQYRWATRQSLRPLAAEIGISFSTLNRLEHGNTPDAHSLAKILMWLLEAVDE